MANDMVLYTTSGAASAFQLCFFSTVPDVTANWAPTCMSEFHPNCLYRVELASITIATNDVSPSRLHHRVSLIHTTHKAAQHLLLRSQLRLVAFAAAASWWRYFQAT